MTNSTTGLTQSIRERLAPLACRTYFDDVPGWSHEYDNDPGTWEDVVDAILAELMEPSEGMLWEGYQKYSDIVFDEDMTGEDKIREILVTVLQHIRDGGQ